MPNFLTRQIPSVRQVVYPVPLTGGNLSSLTSTINQPYIVVYPQQPSLSFLQPITPVVPVLPTGFPSNTISQPVLFSPLSPTQPVIPFLQNVVTMPSNTRATLLNTIGEPYIVLFPQYPPTQGIFYPVPLTNGVIPTLTQTISQPVFSLPPPQQPPARDKFYQVPLAQGIVPSLTNTISQPYIVLYPQQPNARDKFYPVPLTTGAISSLINTISQPIPPPPPQQPTIPFLQNITVLQAGYASWLAKTVSQPTYGLLPLQPQIPFLQNIVVLPYQMLVTLNKTIYQPTPQVQLMQPAISYLQNIPVSSSGFASWARNSISQPYFTPWDVNTIGTQPVNVKTYFTTPFVSFSMESIGQPISITQLQIGLLAKFPLSVLTLSSKTFTRLLLGVGL